MILILALGGIVGGQVVLVLDEWPEDWTSAAQATLAGAIISLNATILVAILSAGVKWIFDSITLKTTYRLEVQKTILGEFREYAAQYLIPLSVACGDLSAYLRQFRELAGSELDSDEWRQRVAEAQERAFYNLARYMKSREAIRSVFNLPEVEPAPGIFLASMEAERRVWDWMPEPWAFQVWSLDDAATLVHALDQPIRTASEALAFLKETRATDTKLHRIYTEFIAWMKAEAHLEEHIVVLTSLNQLISYEVATVYRPWYGQSASEPTDAMDAMKNLSAPAKERLGIFYSPDFK